MNNAQMVLSGKYKVTLDNDMYYLESEELDESVTCYQNPEHLLEEILDELGIEWENV